MNLGKCWPFRVDKTTSNKIQTYTIYVENIRQMFFLCFSYILIINVAEVLQKAQSSIQSITTSDITEIRKMRAPPQAVLDVLDAVFLLLGAKETTRAEIPKDLLNRLLTFNIFNAKFSDIKYLQKYFETYPDPNNIKKASKAVSGLWHWLNSVYKKRLFVEFYGVKGKFKRDPTWESLNFTKSEEEATGERFTQWITTTQEYIDQIQPRDINEMKSCRILSDNLTKVLKAIGPLFGARTEKQLQKFVAEGWKIVSHTIIFLFHL